MGLLFFHWVYSNSGSPASSSPFCGRKTSSAMYFVSSVLLAPRLQGILLPSSKMTPGTWSPFRNHSYFHMTLRLFHESQNSVRAHQVLLLLLQLGLPIKSKAWRGRVLAPGPCHWAGLDGGLAMPGEPASCTPVLSSPRAGSRKDTFPPILQIQK